jgi:hypothetical protein
MNRLPADVRRSIQSQTNKQIGPAVLKILLKEFEIIKQRMINDFNNHPVTAEIEDGENANNSSKTLNGYGNLFTFIGFPSGYDPIEPIRSRLEETRIIKQKVSRGVIDFITTEPTRDELFSMTKFSNFRSDFEGSRSWLDGIETGISGLGFYLYMQGKNIEKSRSGPAIQIKGGKNDEKAFGGGSTGGAIANQRTRFTRTSYISSILKDFRRSVTALNGRLIK